MTTAPSDIHETYRRALTRAGLTPEDPLWSVLWENHLATVRVREAYDTLTVEAKAAVTAILDASAGARDRAAADLKIIETERNKAIAITESVRVRTEQFSTEQANVMVGAIVNEALASLKGAFLGMWKGELEGAMLDITRPTTIRWAVTGFIAAVITIVSLMGAGAWWEHRHIGYQAMVGGQCLENMVADPKSNVLWCQLDLSQVHKQDQPATQSADKR